jgi:hypothetical protein
LHFSLMLLRKASAVEGETRLAAWLYHRCNQSIHWTEGVTVMSLSASLLQKIILHMDHLCEIALNRKLLRKFEKCCKFSGWIEAQLCNSSHSQLDVPVCRNMALPVHPQLLQFQPLGKCVGRGGLLASFSEIFWCDVVCTADDKSTVNQSQTCINLYEFWCVMHFWWPHCVCRELSKHHSAAVSLAFCVVCCAGLYLQVQAMLLLCV